MCILVYSVYVPTYLPAYIHSYLPTYLPTYLNTYIHYITLHYIKLHYIIFHYITLHTYMHNRRLFMLSNFLTRPFVCVTKTATNLFSYPTQSRHQCSQHVSIHADTCQYSQCNLLDLDWIDSRCERLLLWQSLSVCLKPYLCASSRTWVPQAVLECHKQMLAQKPSAKQDSKLLLL